VCVRSPSVLAIHSRASGLSVSAAVAHPSHQTQSEPSPLRLALNWLFPDLNFFDLAQCLMVRRWRLIGHFPILYNPSVWKPPPRKQTQACSKIGS
jgi:hypothetical protein